MAEIDKSYHELLDTILNEGYNYEDPNRKGTYRTEIDEYTIRHDLTKGFPAITTKELAWKSVVGELIWFLKGDTNIKYLVDNGINIWNKDAFNYFKNQKIANTVRTRQEFIKMVKKGVTSKKYTYGDLGPIYGQQWRNFGGVDQFSNLIKNLKEKPLGTDHIVTAWNVGELDNMGLKPCHYGLQIMVRPLMPSERKKHIRTHHQIKMEECTEAGYDKKGLPKYGFTLKWEQRSVDTFLGLPFNIASYATLAHTIGKLTNMVPLKLVGSLSKVHIYDNALHQANAQLRRDTDKYKAANLKLSKGLLGEANYVYEGQMHLDRFLDRIVIDDFELNGYKSYPAIKAEMLAYNN